MQELFKFQVSLYAFHMLIGDFQVMTLTEYALS